MAKLSKREADALKALQAKQEAPDTPPVSRSLSISIDLGDDAQVEKARKLGLLNDDDDDDGDGDDDDDDGKGKREETPRRRGFFKEEEK